MYPLLGNDPTGLDRRLGLFGLDWAIRELSRAFPGNVLSDSPYLTFGSFPPNLCFDGELPARVCTLAEEGFKARVITIVMLSASIIQGVARYFLDDSMRTDRNVKIGLLSKVKLYDFMVLLNNGDRRGIDSFDMMSVFLRTAVSADLTCATDTPPRLGPRSLLEGYTQSICRREVNRFVAFAVEVGTSPRGFQSRFRPPGWFHMCGIMMGEGLSGTYLNVMSGIVRAIIQDFMVQFDFYGGLTAQDAAHFCETHTVLIQDYLFTVPLSELDRNLLRVEMISYYYAITILLRLKGFSYCCMWFWGRFQVHPLFTLPLPTVHLPKKPLFGLHNHMDGHSLIVLSPGYIHRPVMRA
jgi:hypothetical protein